MIQKPYSPTNYEYFISMILDAAHKENIVNKVCIIRAYETNML